MINYMETFEKRMADNGISLDVSDEVIEECVYYDGYSYWEDVDFVAEYRKKCEAGEGDWSFYSDIYKDVYGVRPRW